MSLKDAIFKNIKNEGYVIKPLENYLLTLSANDEDRAFNVNAPSGIGSCIRARYYSRTGAERDSRTIDPRTRRIFDNGSFVHERIQRDLKACGMLLMDEVPIISDEYNIQGHTDGILQLSDKELGVLEIKSINSRSFSELKKEKEEHRRQGLVYLYCLETRRQYLRKKYPTSKDFTMSILVRKKEYESHFKHLKDGSKFTAKEKLQFQVDLCKKRDALLYNCDTPITKVIFLYESKDTQDLKEFCISSVDSNSQSLIDEILSECKTLNDCVAKNKVPDREGTSKTDSVCRWCDYKTECWN